MCNRMQKLTLWVTRGNVSLTDLGSKDKVLILACDWRYSNLAVGRDPIPSKISDYLVRDLFGVRLSEIFASLFLSCSRTCLCY